MSPKLVDKIVVEGDPQAYEDQHVHSVYNEIASHFSSTRYKPWPIIANFMESLPTGSIGLDSGTGNGKYLPLPVSRPGGIWTIGLDRSIKLLLTAQQAGGVQREVVWGDVLGHGWRTGVFDFAISIATIHHLASPERRTLAIKRLLEVVSVEHGRVLIYVWATEQDDMSKRAIPDGETEEKGTDVFVPWKLMAGNGESSTQTYNRYYHMFSVGELEKLTRVAIEELGLQIGTPDDCNGSGVEVVQSGWERSNHFIELKRWSRNNG